MAITLDKLKANIKKLKEQTQGQSTPGEWPNCIFLPEGTHKGRFIVDPNGDLYERYATYGYFAKGIRAPEYMDKSDLPEGFDQENHDLKKMGEILSGDYLKFKYGAKWNFITYFYLMETDNKSDNWQPGNLYCIICKTKFARAFNDFMSSMSDSIEAIFEILDPSKPCVGWISMTVTGGAQGQTSITYVPHKCEAICPRQDNQTDEQWLEEMGKLGYKPLNVSYIRPGFNQEKYDKLCQEYATALDEAVANRKAKEAGAQPSEQIQAAPVESAPQPEVTQPVQETPSQVTPVPPVAQKEDVFAKWRTKK